MKIKIVLLFVLIVFKLNSVGEYACPFIYNNQSVSDTGMGLESGAANLRNVSPVSALNNPAKLGVFTGVAYEFSNYDYFGQKFTTSQFAFEYNGIGISFPMLNFEGNFGLTKRYIPQRISNSFGETLSTFSPYDTMMSFAVGTNLNNILQKLSLDRNFSPIGELDIFIGYSFNFVQSNILSEKALESYGEYSYEKDYDGKANYSNFGIIFDYTNFIPRHRNFKITAGFNFVNLFEQEITYINEKYSSHLPNGIKFGFSGTYFVTTKNFLSKFNNTYFESRIRQYRNFTDKVFVIHFSNEWALYNEFRKIRTTGLEISFLNIFSYRFAQTKDILQDLESYSFSYGINLMYRNKIGIQFDYTNLYDGYEIYSPEQYSFGIKYNY